MGKMSRTKGAVYEREVVNYLKGRGLTCRRTALSGALDHEKGDVLVTPGYAPAADPLEGECKRRASLPVIFREIEGHDFLAVREDHGETYIVIRLPLFADLLQ